MKQLRVVEKVSMDPAIKELLTTAREKGIETAFDRADQHVMCGFGSTGVCCNHCLEGPCRIAPNGKGPQLGICGADVDTIVARNFLVKLTEGAAPHAEHGREVALALLEAAEGKAPYEIRGKDKLMYLAQALEIPTEGRTTQEVAKDLALKALQDFQQQSGVLNWLKLRGQKKSVAKWEEMGLLPANAHIEIAQSVTRTAMGCDADPMNLLLGGLRMGLVDGYSGLHMSTDLQDVMFGIPKAVKAEYNMGAIDESKINIAVHGHLPLMSEKVVEWSRKLNGEAIAVGAAGINVVGICCTGNELLMRQGVSVASSFASQELAIVTGALESMVVDVQCIMPGVQRVAECYHTEIITTLPYVKIAGATHVEFHPETADQAAEEIVRKSIANYSKRDKNKVAIPNVKTEAYAGFSVEQIVGALSAVNGEDPLKPLLDAIAGGQVRGVAAIVGCTNPRENVDVANVIVARELLKNDILVVATGCSAHSLAKHDLMNEKGLEYCGEGIKGVLKAVGNAVGMESLPPTLHMGSCVDNSRPADLLTAIADKLDIHIGQLPVVGTCPETHSPKALSIGTYFLAHGVDVHIGVSAQVEGSKFVVDMLTGDRTDEGVNLDKVFGGKLIYEPDPYMAAQKILERIEMKRKELGFDQREVNVKKAN